MTNLGQSFEVQAVFWGSLVPWGYRAVPRVFSGGPCDAQNQYEIVGIEPQGITYSGHMVYHLTYNKSTFF